MSPNPKRLSPHSLPQYDICQVQTEENWELICKETQITVLFWPGMASSVLFWPGMFFNVLFIISQWLESSKESGWADVVHLPLGINFKVIQITQNAFS